MPQLDQVLNIQEKRREEKRKEIEASPKAKVYDRDFHFVSQGAMECTVEFTIDTCTIKRKTLMRLWLSSASTFELTLRMH